MLYIIIFLVNSSSPKLPHISPLALKEQDILFNFLIKCYFCLCSSSSRFMFKHVTFIFLKIKSLKTGC